MVRIHNSKTGKQYVAHSVHECKDATDASIYRTCIKMKTTISMGGIIAQYIGG